MNKVRLDMETKIHYTAILPTKVYEEALEKYGSNLEALKEAILQQFQKLFEEEINVEDDKAYVLPETASIIVAEHICDD